MALISLVLIVPFFWATKIKAADDHLVINEIYAAPYSGGEEWVELYNPTLADINLSDYSLKDGSVAAKNLSTTITAGDYFVYEVSSGWLNNSGETLSLIYKPSPEIIDQVTYGDWNDNQDNQPPAPENNKSLQRIPNGSDTNDDQADFRILAPSKGAKNILPVYSNQIIINEIVPEPQGGSANEFIELCNTGSVDVDLSNWQLDDIENGGSSPYAIPNGTIINVGSYITFYNAVTKIALNDSGDSARLMDPNSEIKDSLSYTTAIKGQSYSRFSDTWKWSLALTPNQQNIFQEEVLASEVTSTEVVPINEAKKLEVGDDAVVEGVVTAPPGVLSSQYFYIEDSSGGIQVYCYAKDFPELKIGQKIRVNGEMAVYSSEKRIKITQSSDIIILSNAEEVSPEKNNISDIVDDDVGSLILTQGVVSQTSGDTFVISDGKSIAVIIRSSTGIVKPKMKKGDKVAITGIVSSYKGMLRILPINQSGVTILSSGKLPTTGGSEIINQKPRYILLVFIEFLGAFFCWCRKRLRPSKFNKISPYTLNF